LVGIIFEVEEGLVEFIGTTFVFFFNFSTFLLSFFRLNFSLILSKGLLLLGLLFLSFFLLFVSCCILEGPQLVLKLFGLSFSFSSLFSI